jgi:hypothetical protein
MWLQESLTKGPAAACEVVASGRCSAACFTTAVYKESRVCACHDASWNPVGCRSGRLVVMQLQDMLSGCPTASGAWFGCFAGVMLVRCRYQQCFQR